MAHEHRLTRDERLQRSADFQRVYQRRCSSANDWLIMLGCENHLPYSRLGLSVGRLWGKAVVRNRIRRLYREAFRLTKNKLPAGMDIILIPRRIEEVSLVRLMEALPILAEKVKTKLKKRSAHREGIETKSGSDK